MKGSGWITALPGRDRTTISQDTAIKWEAGLWLLTSESTAADASIIICQLDTVQAPPGVAGVGQALVDVPLTALSCKALGTEAAVAPDLVNALPSVEAAGTSRVQDAVIHILLTEAPCQSKREGELEIQCRGCLSYTAHQVLRPCHTQSLK